MSSTDQSPRVPLWQLGLIFFHIGAVAFGGMWAAIDRIEKELIHKRHWATETEVRAMMITAALIPAPKFLAFGGMVGYQLRGFPGSVIALVSLMAPGFSIILLVTMMVGQAEPGSLLESVQHMLTLAIVGLLLGNAAKMATKTQVPIRQRVVGVSIWASIPLAVLLGNLSLLLMAVLGLVIGSWLIRPNTVPEEPQA